MKVLLQIQFFASLALFALSGIAAWIFIAAGEWFLSTCFMAALAAEWYLFVAPSYKELIEWKSDKH